MAKTDIQGGPIFGPLQTSQLYEQIVGQIRDQIASGGLAPGARLPSERNLARAFEVSRPSIREAVAELQNEGLVVTRHGAGSFIAENAMRLLSESSGAMAADASPSALLEARTLFEPAVAKLAARRRYRDRSAEELLDEMESIKDVAAPDQRARWSEADRLFHRQIAAMTANPIVTDLADRIAATMAQPLWRRLRDQALADPRRVHLYAAEHRLIYEAVATGDADASETYARGHLRRVRADMDLE
jgi:DNA-binding FadR family transcriptional regulator